MLQLLQICCPCCISSYQVKPTSTLTGGKLWREETRPHHLFACRSPQPSFRQRQCLHCRLVRMLHKTINAFKLTRTCDAEFLVNLLVGTGCTPCRQTILLFKKSVSTPKIKWKSSYLVTVLLPSNGLQKNNSRIQTLSTYLGLHLPRAPPGRG